MQRPSLRFRTAATLALMTIALHVLAGDAGTAANPVSATTPMLRQQAAQTRPLRCLSPAPRPYQHLTFQPVQQDGRGLGHLLYNDAAGNDKQQHDASQKLPCDSGLQSVADAAVPAATPKPCTIRRDVALQSHFMMLRLCETEPVSVTPETTSQHARQAPIRKAEKVTRMRVMPTT